MNSESCAVERSQSNQREQLVIAAANSADFQNQTGDLD